MAPVRMLCGTTGLDSPVLTPRVCPVPDALLLSASVLLPPLTRPPLSSSQPWAPGPGPASPVAAALWPVSVPRCCDVLHLLAVRELFPRQPGLGSSCMWGETTQRPPPQGSSGHLVIPRSLCSMGECSQDNVDPNLKRNATDAVWLVLPQDGPEQVNPGTLPGRQPPLDDSGGPALGLAPTPGVSTPPARSPLGRCRSLASWTLHEVPHKSPGTHSLPFRYTEPGIPVAAPSQQSSSCATAAKDVCGGRRWTSRKSKALTRGQGQWSMLSRIRIKKKHNTIVQWLFTNLLFPVLSPYTMLRGPAAFVFTCWFWLLLPLHHLPVTEQCIQ